MAWAEEEFAGADLGDKRLNRRLIKLTERFADKPTASIPGPCADWSETAGTYRFFDQANNENRPLGWETILTPHMDSTVARIRQHPVALCLQALTFWITERFLGGDYIWGDLLEYTQVDQVSVTIVKG